MGAGGIGNINGTLSLVNSTVSGNMTGGRGGGIYSEALIVMGNLSNVSTVDLVSSTVADNAGSAGANLHNSGNGGEAFFRLRSTIVSDPRDDDSNCGSAGNGSFTSLGYNLADDDGCSLTESTDLQETDPLLGALVANGGLTPTHTLLPGSPAIDRGTSDTALTGVGVLTTDQRGLTRPIDFAEAANAAGGDGADIGAFEVQRPPPPPTSPPPPAPPAPPSTPRVPDDAVTIRIVGKRLRINRRLVARIRLSCPRAEATPPCRGTLTLRTRKRVQLRGKRRKVVLERARFSIPAGETKKVRLKFKRAGVRLLRRTPRSRRVVVILKVRDAAGNQATERKRMTVLSPAPRR